MAAADGEPSEPGSPQGKGSLFRGIAAQQLRNAVQQRVFGLQADPIKIDHYTVLKPIGSGGMGVVYAAYDTELDRKVAVKLLRGSPPAGEGTTWRTRLLREAQALAKLSHPNVVQVYGVGEHDGQIYVSMEFIDGPNLRDHCAPMRAWRSVLQAYIEAGRGLAAAHAAGIVHRDFKPENVLVGADGRPRVLDFGLARGAGDARIEEPEVPAAENLGASSSHVLLTPITRSGLLMGTPAYMAPEQHDGRPADARSDQFSFCVAVYEALYGARPFAGKTLTALKASVAGGKVQPPPRDSRVPAWLRRVLLRGLAVDQEARHPSMEVLLVELQKDPAVMIRRLAAVLVILVIALAGFWLWRLREERHAERQAALQEAATLERQRAEAAEQRLIDRADALTLAEVDVTLGRDPTRAAAMLLNLSNTSPGWEGAVRIIAADAIHQGVARHVLRLGEGEVPHGLSPDARHAVTRHPRSGMVRLLDVHTGAVRDLAESEAGLPVVTFSRDGSRLGSLRLPDGVGVWALEDLSYRPLGKGSVEHHVVVFSGDGRWLLTHGRDPEVQIWDLQTGESHVLADHEDSVPTVATSEDGRFLASVDGYGTLRRFALPAGEPDILEGTSPIAFSRGGTLVAVRMTDLILHPPEPGEEPKILRGRDVPIVCLAASSDGHFIAAGDIEGGVRLWDLESEEARDLPGHAEEITSLRFVGDQPLLTTTSLDNTLGLLDLKSGRVQRLRGHVGVGFWELDSQAEKLVTVGWEGTIRQWDLQPNEAPPSRAPADILAVVGHRADDALAAGGEDGSVWRVAQSAWEPVARHQRSVTALAWSPDGRRLASGDRGGGVRIEGDDGAEALEIVLGEGEIHALAFSPDASRVAAGLGEGGIGLVDVASGRHHAIETGDYRARWLSFTAAGQDIVTVGWIREGPSSIRHYEATSGALKGSFDLTTEGVLAAAFSADGSTVAYTTLTRGVHFWRSDGQKVAHLGDHRGLVFGIDVTPDGQTVATASVDGSVRLWDIASGRSRGLDVGGGPLRMIAFAQGGKAFAAVGEDGRLWRGRDELPREPEALRQWLEHATDFRVEQTPLE